MIELHSKLKQLPPLTSSIFLLTYCLLYCTPHAVYYTPLPYTNVHTYLLHTYLHICLLSLHYCPILVFPTPTDSFLSSSSRVRFLHPASRVIYVASAHETLSCSLPLGLCRLAIARVLQSFT
ncbi:hypothetical protein F5Y15DRAFT_258650 [Xylariaceae sp. FL0016]|nr:hypothetical protein F5Y15DRAFT_258650 [Xylariaceae sp. FL0016]